MEDAVFTLVPVLPYLSVPTEGTNSLSHENRESKRHGRGCSRSGCYGSIDLRTSYGSYGGPQVFLLTTLLFYKYLMQMKCKKFICLTLLSPFIE